MENIKIREEAKRNGVYQWQIAEALGVSEVTFCKKLRRELPQETTDKILTIIQKLAGGEKNDD